MVRNKHRGNNNYPFRAGFNPKPKQVFRFKTEKILGSLYLTKPLLERIQIKQLKLALNVEKESGIPLRADIFDGNRADVAIVVENLKKLRLTLKKEDLLFTGDNAMGTIPNCLKLNSNQIRFIAPSPASVYFEQAFASVTEEELNRLVFPDKDGTPKFKVTERGVFIDHRADA